MFVLLLLAAAIFLFVILHWMTKPDPRLPPFPVRPLPLLGNLAHIGPNLRPLFKKWRATHGDIFSLKLGGTLVVVLNGYDVLKEALVKKAEFFSDRPYIFADEASGMLHKGVIFARGQNWKDQRTVSLNILRMFGMGKNILAEKIQEEVNCFMDYLSSLKEQPTDIRVMTNISVSNVICSIIIGHRFEYDEPEIQSIVNQIREGMDLQKTVNVINFVPCLKFLPGDLFNAKKMTAIVQSVLGLIKKIVDAKKKVDIDSQDVNNFIDAYTVEMKKMAESGESTNLDDQNLIKIIYELFVAGTETTSTAIYWCILYFLNYPEIQERVHQEIVDVVGMERTPTVQDKAKLPYLNAVIKEVQRLSSSVSLALPHSCPEDVTLRGYTLPKGTFIIPNLDSVLYDKNIWGDDAMSFRPERFLDDQGKIKNPEEFIPFSLGRRSCLGEALARMELFLFLASLCQRFKFVPVNPASPPSLEPVFGLIAHPGQYEVRVLERFSAP